MLVEPVSSVEGLQCVVDGVVEELAKRAVDVWRPTEISPGGREGKLAARELRADGVTPWGSGPWMTVFAAAHLLYVATLEHVRAVVPLLSPPFRVWAVSVQARAALEAATQIHWLLDPKIANGRLRVARLYAARLASSREFERAYNLTRSPEPITDYGKSPNQIKAEAAHLGLVPIRNKSRDVVGYEGEHAPRYTERVRSLLGDESAYSILSGAAHAEMWWLLGGSRDGAPSPLGLSADEHAAEFDDLKPIVLQCLHALIGPVDRACRLFHRGGTLEHLRLLVQRTDRTFGL